MKRLVLTLALLLCVLPLSAVAGTKQSASINLSEPVVISGTHLRPGDYVIRWNGTGSDVQVQFLQGKKELVSVSAKLLSQHNAESPAITMRSTDDGSKTISEIDLSKVTLQFPEKTDTASK
jgi:hypothetical protein